MRSLRLSVFLLVGVLAFSLSSCAAIGEIFKAGAYTGIIGVVIVVAIIIFVVSKISGGGGGSQS
ncbi:hypothetical protein ACFQ48_06030 [Hymenobacter caeli]|uniref:Phosphatidate cytidylyltransferase n=1 Tax=Hymenobacter caeli TaxID=2735894 RepID=A0ABX2FQ61_9BACT|nr:hypothetical protein [Hymenobacter caeli]NRT18560.1 hypothetical protein [Hymenobacter caeli]